MFDKILIANRGEIAVRIIRTCKKLGVKTVAVYSESDSRCPHVALADEAVPLGGLHSQDSYLNADKVIAAARQTGASAIHPGYGFLSENAQFAKAAEIAGITFIGPSSDAIAMMGDKISSKELAIKAGVPVIPGHVDALRDPEEALTVAESIGYPVLLKPAAGGGGKGMRIVNAPEEMAAALAASQQETRKAFGDSRIFMERFIIQPRHVEIQILADTKGNVVHLGERECSIQRRYQKVIEESPSPGVDEDLRQRMGKAACDLARKAGYTNAGTVEYVLDPQGAFYFLEMNTRLQVEHPVTEMVTGLDLVEQQLRIASGQPLPFDQAGVKVKGWSMEARICAEDPSKNFIPSTGMITRYAEPSGDGIRVDSGVQTGSKIGVYFDSMLAKIIATGEDREEARSLLVEALNGYHIEGVTSNTDFVNSVLCHQDFIDCNLTTAFIDDHFEGDRTKVDPDPERLRHAALAATLIYHVRTVAVKKSLRAMATRIGGEKAPIDKNRYMVRSEGEIFDILLEGTTAGHLWTITVNDQRYSVGTPDFEFYRRRLKLNINGRTHRFRLRLDNSFVFTAFSGLTRQFEVYTPKEWKMMAHMPAATQKQQDNILACPMPGLVVDVLAKKGERVYRGQNLVILESMKMESGVASPCDGIVESISVSAGQAVEADEILIRFKA